ncbi:hypothetical protein Bca4012_047435 [Brassica carinata]|uniref:Uncharacterized protein n=1 Tax=Brassica carinata TaxID=52824 RepID=A0A8X7R3Z8_BRACI|nr:hypothetical protein Bca52824_050598 [Brassica carinata]
MALGYCSLLGSNCLVILEMSPLYLAITNMVEGCLTSLTLALYMDLVSPGLGCNSFVMKALNFLDLAFVLLPEFLDLCLKLP